MAIEQIGAAQEFELEKEQYGHEAVEPERLIGSIEALPVTFDPEEELRQIRGIGGSEGLRHLEAFRAKLLENKEQLADVQTELISFIRENVDMPIEDIMSYALALEIGRAHV